MELSFKGTDFKSSLSQLIDILHKANVNLGQICPILLTAKNETLRLKILQDSVYVRQNIPAKIIKSGTICLSAVALQKLTWTSKEVLLKQEKAKIKIKHANFQYILPCLDVVGVQDPKNLEWVSFPADIIKTLCKTMSLTARQTATLDVNLILEKSGLALETVDFPYVGVRAFYPFKHKYTPARLTLPLNFLKTILKINKDEEMNLNFQKEQLCFRSTTTLVTQPAKQVELPDIKEALDDLFKEEPTFFVTLELKASLEQLKACLKQKNFSITLTYENKTLKFNSVSEGVESTSNLSFSKVSPKKKFFKAYLSAEYLIDIFGLLSHTGEKDLSMYFWGDKTVAITAGSTKFMMPQLENNGI